MSVVLSLALRPPSEAEGSGVVVVSGAGWNLAESDWDLRETAPALNVFLANRGIPCSALPSAECLVLSLACRELCAAPSLAEEVACRPQIDGPSFLILPRAESRTKPGMTGSEAAVR
jgi:hypothetical protein